VSAPARVRSSSCCSSRRWLHATVVVDEALRRRAGPRAPMRAAQQRPERRRVRPDSDPAVGGPEGLVGRGQAVRGAGALGDPSGGEELRGLPDGEREGGLEQRDVDASPHAVALPTEERADHGDRAVQARAQVPHRHAALDRVPARLARDTHDTGHALSDEIEPRTLRVGTGLSEAGDRCVDEPGETVRAARPSRRRAGRRRRGGSSRRPRRPSR
jgi:hypothetical protein